MTTRHAIIAAMNDQFRAHGPTQKIPGKMFTTASIAALPPQILAGVVAKVRTFAEFTEDNDPYHEHDFGAFDVERAGRVFWKIDYYADGDMETGAEDPAEQCFRVLTIMLASEY